MDGNCRDFTSEIILEENKSNKKDTSTPEQRKLIDSLVESVCSCRSDKNENVQLQVIKVYPNNISKVSPNMRYIRRF